MSFDLVAWLRRDTLPLWQTVGFDRDAGTFLERLDVEARPLSDTPRRAMVQARQIFVFAAAHEKGWCDGAAALAEQAGAMLVRHYRSDGLPGWAFSAARDGSIIDGRRDFYAQAFVLFALAHLARLTGQGSWLDLADDTLRFMDEHMATPATGGYAEGVPAVAAPRRQNPHMHLLEALLALHEADASRAYLPRADRIVELMRRRFLRGPCSVLVEYYDHDLNPAGSPPFTFEPGHHCEWAWLLTRHAQLGGRGSAPSLAGRLWTGAVDLGMDEHGTIFDEVGGTGRIIQRSTRLWPYTEAARAATLAIARPDRAVTAPSIAREMAHRFLKPAAKGCWVDHLSADGTPLSTAVPASSLYHLVGAALAIDDEGRGPGGQPVR